MPSPKLRLLTDESVAVENEINALRSLEPKDDADRESIEGRLAAAQERAAKIAAEAKREGDLDAAIASMQAVRSSDKSREDVEKQFRQDEESETKPDIRAGVRAFRSVKVAEAVGRHLCGLAGLSKRAMGETVDGFGDDYVVTELYSAIVNRLQYQSVAMQLASIFRPRGQKITLPKSGDVTFGFAAENVAFSDQDISTRRRRPGGRPVQPRARPVDGQRDVRRQHGQPGDHRPRGLGGFGQHRDGGGQRLHHGCQPRRRRRQG